MVWKAAAYLSPVISSYVNSEANFWHVVQKHILYFCLYRLNDHCLESKQYIIILMGITAASSIPGNHIMGHNLLGSTNFPCTEYYVSY